MSLFLASFCALSAFLLVTAGYHVAVLPLPLLSCLLLPLLLIPLLCCSLILPPAAGARPCNVAVFVVLVFFAQAIRSQAFKAVFFSLLGGARMVVGRQPSWAPELQRKLELMPAASALPALFFLYDHDTFNLLLFNCFASFDRNGGDALFLWMSSFPRCR